MTQFDGPTLICTQDISVIACFIKDLMDFSALSNQFDAFVTFRLNQLKFVVQNAIAVRTVANNCMVRVHLRSREDLRQLHLSQLQVSVRVLQANELPIRTHHKWLLTDVSCFCQHRTVSELALILDLDVHCLVSLIQKCLSIAEQSVRKGLLSNRHLSFAGLHGKVSALYAVYMGEI